MRRSALVMSDADLRAAFAAHTGGATQFTRRMAITMADFAGMKPMSLVWRLETMGLLKPGSWDWFRSNGGITAVHIKQVRGEKHR